MADNELDDEHLADNRDDIQQQQQQQQQHQPPLEQQQQQQQQHQPPLEQQQQQLPLEQQQQQQHQQQPIRQQQQNPEQQHNRLQIEEIEENNSSDSSSISGERIQAAGVLIDERESEDEEEEFEDAVEGVEEFGERPPSTTTTSSSSGSSTDSSSGEEDNPEERENTSELDENDIDIDNNNMGNRVVNGLRNRRHLRRSSANEAGPSNRDLDRLERRKRRRNFDGELAAQHQYLGADDDVTGVQAVHIEDDILNNVRHVVLMPGQTLPLHSLHPRAVQMFRNIIAHQKTFAVVNKRYTLDNELAQVCTLAQVLSYKDVEEDEMSVIKLKAIGRQRAQLLQTTNCLDGTTVAKVRVLPEITLPSSLQCAQSTSMQRRFGNSGHRNRPSAYKYSRYHASVFTPVPWFVHKQYDLDVMVDEISKILDTWYDPARVSLMAQRPREFSFWVASLLPVNDEQKLKLLTIDCDQKRLQTLLQLLTRCDQLRCSSCTSFLAERRAIFSMSTDGPMAAYVNTGGYVHEMITVLHADNYNLFGAPTTANSWFPGYAWTIANCAECGSHLGWRFTAVKKNLKPHKFFGITRSAIRPAMSGGSEHAEDNADEYYGMQQVEEGDDTLRRHRPAQWRILQQAMEEMQRRVQAMEDSDL